MSANESSISARQCSSEIKFVSPDNVYAVCELLRLQEDAPNFVQFGVFELKSLAKAQETIPELVFGLPLNKTDVSLLWLKANDTIEILLLGPYYDSLIHMRFNTYGYSDIPYTKLDTVKFTNHLSIDQHEYLDLSLYDTYEALLKTLEDKISAIHEMRLNHLSAEQHASVSFDKDFNYILNGSSLRKFSTAVYDSIAEKWFHYGEQKPINQSFKVGGFKNELYSISTNRFLPLNPANSVDVNRSEKSLLLVPVNAPPGASIAGFVTLSSIELNDSKGFFSLPLDIIGIPTDAFWIEEERVLIIQIRAIASGRIDILEMQFDDNRNFLSQLNCLTYCETEIHYRAREVILDSGAPAIIYSKDQTQNDGLVVLFPGGPNLDVISSSLEMFRVPFYTNNGFDVMLPHLNGGNSGWEDLDQDFLRHKQIAIGRTSEALDTFLNLESSKKYKSLLIEGISFGAVNAIDLLQASDLSFDGILLVAPLTKPKDSWVKKHKGEYIDLFEVYYGASQENYQNPNLTTPFMGWWQEKLQEEWSHENCRVLMSRTDKRIDNVFGVSYFENLKCHIVLIDNVEHSLVGLTMEAFNARELLVKSSKGNTLRIRSAE